MAYGTAEHGLSQRRACRLFNISRSVYRYQAKKVDDEEIQAQLQILAQKKPTWGL